MPQEIDIGRYLNENEGNAVDYGANRVITRAVSLDFLSERDQSALKLGRLLVNSVMDVPEVSTLDQVSRFFLDSWLSRSGSSAKQADTLSIELLCRLDKVKAEQDRKIEAGQDIPNSNLCIAAFEALDTVVNEFGATNPILRGEISVDMLLIIIVAHFSLSFILSFSLTHILQAYVMLFYLVYLLMHKILVKIHGTKGQLNFLTARRLCGGMNA